MATLAAAFGTSHSTMLMSSLENWLATFDHVDCRAPIYDFSGAQKSYEELLRNVSRHAAELMSPAAIAARHGQAREAMDRLERDIASARLDALIVVGDDQREIFKDDSRPAIGIYYGETIRNAAARAQPPEDWYQRDQNKRLEDGADAHYPCHVALATHLIEGLTREGFDITAVKRLADAQFEGHAYSFVHRRYLRARPLPIVPVFLNTYYPPNQPTPRRCLELGAKLRELVACLPGNLRVGVMASGGLSHFLVNEALDAKVIDAIRRADMDALASLPAATLESGSSEIRNWICVAAAARDLELDWVSYIAGYRSSALTGVGLCFAHWS
jgi:hypothetical protein